MGRQSQRSAVWPDLGRHQTFWSRPKSDQHCLTRAEFRDAVAAQRFHVDENIGSSFASGEEAEIPAAG